MILRNPEIDIMAKPNKRMYFTQDTENAILEFLAETDVTKRNSIYKDRINYSFHKLIENLIHTYKFYYYEVSYEDTKHEAIAHLIEKLHMYKQSSGKAYSYFTIVGRNYLINKNKSMYSKIKNNENLEIIDTERNLPTEIHNKEALLELKSFVDYFVEYCDNNLTTIFTKKLDIQIASSILELFRRRANIENYNKKALYILIREMTNADTHDITKVVKTFKTLYTDLHAEYTATLH